MGQDEIALEVAQLAQQLADGGVQLLAGILEALELGPELLVLVVVDV